MSSDNLETQKAVVRQWVAVANSLDRDAIRKLCSPAYSAQVDDMMTWVANTFSDHQLTIQELIAEGNRVMARMHSKGRHTGEFFGVPGTGRQWEDNEGAMIFRFENGLIRDIWNVWNIPLHLEKLGLKLTVST